MSVVDLLASRGGLRALDHQLALALGRLVGETDERVLLGAALASRAVGRGHVCVDLGAAVASPLLDDDDEPIVDVTLPSLDDWLDALRASELVAPSCQGPPRPMVLDEKGSGSRLYLWRYASYQQRLAEALTTMAATSMPLDTEQVAPDLRRLFPNELPQGEIDRQRLAVLVALRRRFTVISGGPGTGKTTTVARLLAMLQAQALAVEGRPLRMTLVAPTGKAAQRLGEAIEASARKLDVDPAVRAAIPTRAATIHRTLVFQPQTPTRFQHGRDQPLATDLVLADEASMIDLALMTKLVEAVPSSARLVLLGDRDQLTSVEAGAILGDIFDPARHPGYSRGFAAEVRELTGEAIEVARDDAPPIADCVVQLTKSYRYGATSGIGALARAVNDGDQARAVAVLKGDAAMPYGEVALASLDPGRPLEGSLGRTVVDGYRGLFDGAEPADRLARLGAFRLLCAHRRGDLGVEGMNAAIEHHLRRAGLSSATGDHYDGRPILVTQNDHQLELFNGDVGVIVHRPGRAARAFFPDPNGGVRSFHPSRLPPHETVFAMTVHKSQGSEFDRVALLLPKSISPVLTRELVYTALSRARQRADIHGDEAVLRAAIERRIVRASGLGKALWGEEAFS